MLYKHPKILNPKAQLDPSSRLEMAAFAKFVVVLDNVLSFQISILFENKVCILNCVFLKKPQTKCFNAFYFDLRLDQILQKYIRNPGTILKNLFHV